MSERRRRSSEHSMENGEVTECIYKGPHGRRSLNITIVAPAYAHNNNRVALTSNHMAYKVDLMP